LKKIIG